MTFYYSKFTQDQDERSSLPCMYAVKSYNNFNVSTAFNLENTSKWLRSRKMFIYNKFI